MSAPEYELFQLGDWELQCGESIPDAYIAYKTFGDHTSPAIVYPTWYSGAISDNVWLIGGGKALNPEHYFIIIPALFGNGQSSSPSNHHTLKNFPKVTFYDNVRAQHKLVTEKLGIKHLRAVLGWSMGAGQTYQWATQYPNIMDLCIPFCGSARTSLHNKVFLEGVKSAMLAAKGIPSAGPGEGGVATKGEQFRIWSAEEKEIGMKAFGRGYAGWGFSQAFYRAELFKELGFEDLESFMTGFWETWACSKDPENMLLMLQTWQDGDCSKQEPYNGDFVKAMQAIKAKMLVLPGKTDLYFPPEDSEIEVKNMKAGIGQMHAFPSIWGHWAGGPGDSKDDVTWLDDHLKIFFVDSEVSMQKLT
ncbi:MAG: homoserine acetyltransferase family [Lasallia pustulata]|uniref:Homoserine acetyltransferase family n=1 Tax=Lasallia pustulata TaxID=136370 RepID=A0A5M8PT58_9LECA|nr:MAG: homoserine acetyltransferase family [Lasallia pustulata]